MSEKKNQEGIVWNVAKNAIGAKLGQQGILKSLLSETIQHLGKNPFQGIQNQKQKFDANYDRDAKSNKNSRDKFLAKKN